MVESLLSEDEKKDKAAEYDIALSTISTILKSRDKLQVKRGVWSNTKKILCSLKLMLPHLSGLLQ